VLAAEKGLLCGLQRLTGETAAVSARGFGLKVKTGLANAEREMTVVLLGVLQEPLKPPFESLGLQRF